MKLLNLLENLFVGFILLLAWSFAILLETFRWLFSIKTN